MISTEHLRAEPYIYRTVPYIYRTEPNHHIPARKINRTVPYRGYVRLALDTIEHEPNRIDGEMYGTVRFGTDSPLCLGLNSIPARLGEDFVHMIPQYNSD